MKRCIPLLLLAAMVGSGCNRQTPAAERVPLDGGTTTASTLPEDIRVQVDSGNVAYRNGNYEEALRHYQEATRRDPNQATGWYGVAMAAGALGREELADSAGRRVHQLNPELGFGQHPTPGADTMPPSPHP